MVWYSHLFKNFPQFVVIHTVKGFGVVNKAEDNVFLEFSCLFYDPTDVGNLSLVSLTFLFFSFFFILGGRGAVPGQAHREGSHRQPGASGKQGAAE